MINLKNVYSVLYTSFKAHKVADPKTSTCAILNKALQRSQKTFSKVPPTPISLFHYNKIKKLALRRLKHEPIEYIAKQVEFRGLLFDVEKPVVFPSTGSEKLIDIAHALVPEKEEHVHFLEVGCGCGAISIAFMKEKPNAIGVTIDPSLNALELAAKNFYKTFGKDASMDHFQLIQSDFSNFVNNTVHKFDVIIARPPCIPSSEWENLDKEIKYHENRKDLDGGQDGLEKIWELVQESADCLKKDGYLVIEMNKGQPEYFEEYFRKNRGVAHDLSLHKIQEDVSGKSFLILKKAVTKSDTPKAKKTKKSDSQVKS